MNCAVHPGAEATGFCRNCGKALCPQCTRDVRGVLYCQDCLAALVSHPQMAAGTPNPTLALILGWVPGLGAVYNGEYMKGLIHILIFAGLIALLNTDQVNQSTPTLAFLALSLVGFILYMPFEAFNTAKARAQGLPAPDLFRSPSAPKRAAPSPGAGPTPAVGASVAADFAAAPGGPTPETRPATRNWVTGPAILILIGGVFLLVNLGLLPSHWLDRGWPLILIVIGSWLLWRRLRPSS